MNVAPSASFEAVIETGETGQTTDIGLLVIDNIGGTTTAFSTATISEVDTGVYAAIRTAPTVAGSYTIVWKLLSTSEVVGIEDLRVTSSAPADPVSGDTYATTSELARILKIRTPTTEQTEAMERVLLTATGEIDSEIDREDDLENWQVALVTEVCLERAVEHWQQMETPWGIVGLGDTGAVYTSRDSWSRHALKLAPAKQQWGIA